MSSHHKFMLVNESAPNETYDLVSTLELDAAFEALERLGWWLAVCDEEEC